MAKIGLRLKAILVKTQKNLIKKMNTAGYQSVCHQGITRLARPGVDMIAQTHLGPGYILTGELCVFFSEWAFLLINTQLACQETALSFSSVHLVFMCMLHQRVPLALRFTGED